MINLIYNIRDWMSSINFNRGSVVSDDLGEVIEKEDDAEFFSIAQQYNSRRMSMTNHHSIQKMNTIYNFNYKTTPKNAKNSEIKEEKSRKTRSYQQGRQYICGACKSGYLSYPALYTHIKTKHNGIYPEGTIRGKNNNNKKRGRPKTLRKQPTLQYRQEPQSQFPSEYCNLVEKESISIANEDEREEDEKVQITLPIFVQQVRELKKMNNSIMILSLIKVMTIYLYNVKEYLKADSMLTVETVSEKLITFINHNFQKLLKDYQDQSQYYVRKGLPPKYQNNYCGYEKCDYLPVFIHSFLKRLDEEDDQMEISFFNDFSQWLYSKNLTYIKLIKPEVYQVGQQND